jgi:hypothetical protein
MKNLKDIREKTLTSAEKKKREEIAKAMERDNPGMDMGKKMAIATATAKRVAEARASISVGSADKKPENYRDKDGKIKVRMIPVKKTQIQYEAVDYEKLTQLARFGLVDKGNVQKLIAAFKKMEDGKILAPQQRELMLNVLTDLTGIITGDAQMFQKAKKAVKEGTLKEALDNLDIIAEAELDDYQKDKIMTAMLGKNHPYSPANMAKKKKKSAGFATWNKRDPKTGKLLNNSVEEAMKQKLFMFKTEAEANAHAKKNGGKVVKYSPTNYAVLDKDLTKKPGKKPDGMVKESELDEKYDTPVKKKPVSMMSKAEKDKNDERRKSYKEFQKSLRKEETELDEDKLRFADEKTQKLRDRLDDLIFNVMITGNIEYDGKDNPTRHLKTIEKEFGPKVAKQVEAGMDIKNWGRDNRSSGIDRLALRKKSRISASGKMNKQDAVALGKRIMQDKSFGGLTKKVKLPEDTQIDEARPSQRHPLEGHPYHKKTNAELEYIGKDAHKAAQAMKSHNPSAEGKYLDQANDSATVRHFRKTSGTPDWYKKKYGHSMKEEAQIDEISMGKMAAYAPKAVKSRNDAKAATHSADSNRVANAKKVIAKRKAGADNYNKKMWGYANVAPTKESVDEAKVGPSHDEIMKAIGNTQSSAQGMAILQKKFKLTAAQARKHMDMFLKDDVQIDEMGAFMSSPLPTPMSMRKDPPMTRPLMLTNG